MPSRFLGLLLTVAVFSATAQQAHPDQSPRAVSLASLSDSLEQLANAVRPAVVQIFSTSYTPVTGDNDSNTTSGPISRQRATGSGVVISADGYILTNAHVVMTARRIRVRFAATASELSNLHSIIKPEGSIMDGKLVGLDRE